MEDPKYRNISGINSEGGEKGDLGRAIDKWKGEKDVIEVDAEAAQ